MKMANEKKNSTLGGMTIHEGIARRRPTTRAEKGQEDWQPRTQSCTTVKAVTQRGTFLYVKSRVRYREGSLPTGESSKFNMPSMDLPSFYGSTDALLTSSHRHHHNESLQSFFLKKIMLTYHQ